MERQMYYDKPTQVMFYDFDSGDYYSYDAGIAYRDEIICGCCSRVFYIEELWELADEEGLTNPIIRMDWVDISDEIRGDLPCPVPIFTIVEDEFEDIDFKALSAEIFKDK